MPRGADFQLGMAAYSNSTRHTQPSGFVLTAVLGIVGAIVATYLGQVIGWYHAGEGAGLVGAVVGAIIVLLVWGTVMGRRGLSRM